MRLWARRTCFQCRFEIRLRSPLSSLKSCARRPAASPAWGVSTSTAAWESQSLATTASRYAPRTSWTWGAASRHCVLSWQNDAREGALIASRASFSQVGLPVPVVGALARGCDRRAARPRGPLRADRVHLPRVRDRLQVLPPRQLAVIILRDVL